ncbi:MAG: sulfur relay protein DsrC [Gammaproteobacteria bacterium]|nr:MAG: sulfur relay protein DsrC [Gammaproteobacteria bacterium]RLA32027.1 MAG: sulfur relay protein DsrC [Gammaproteobacteria bacterium]
MATIEVKISDIIIQHPEINSFVELLNAVRGITSDNMLFMEFDVKPDFRDTPRDWQWQLEGAFAGGKR